MQYPVPQFTDVEDKIIGPLTIKQFGILFGAGVIIFLAYSSTKSILVLIFVFVLFGVPALGVAFAKINGRPMYNTMGFFVKFLTSPRVLIFHKESSSFKPSEKLKNAELSSAPPRAAVVTLQDTQANFKEVQALLRKTASDESEVAKKMR